MGACLALGSLASCVSVNLPVLSVATGFVQLSISCNILTYIASVSCFWLFSNDTAMSTQRHVNYFTVA